MGGLSKKASQLDTLRHHHHHLLVVDAGGLLFKEAPLPPSQMEPLQATARGIITAYNTMGIQAVGVAGQDLAAGIDFLLAVRKESQFPWLSANLVTRNHAKLLFAPHTIVPAGDGVRIGIIGITGALPRATPNSPPSAVTLLPWQEVLPNQIALLREKTEMLILLSSLPLLENKRIATAHPEIHLILQSGSGGGNLPPEIFNNTVITQTEQQGKQLGLLEVQWNKTSKRWKTGADDNPLLDTRNALDRMEWQLARIRRQGNPEELFRDQPDALTNYRNLVEQRETLARQLTSLNAAAPKQPPADDSSFLSRFVPMTSTVADHPDVRAIVNKTTQEANLLAKRTVGQGQSIPTALPAGYGGNAACGNCHQVQLAKWSASQHARAYDTLAIKGQQYNAACVPCHVTGGFAQPAERLLAVATALPQVGCETCHGPSSSHAASPSTQRPGQPNKEICLQCHTNEHDDNFDFTIDLSRLRCGS